MPARIDVTGQTFGRFTVKRDLGSKCECTCSCGNPKVLIVDKGNLRCGNSKSCGCVKAEKLRQRNTATKAQRSAAYKSRERVREAGRWWVMPKIARNSLKVSYPTLQTWAGLFTPDRRGTKEGGPWLDNRVLGHREITDGNGRKIVYYSEADVRTIQEAKEAREQAEKLAGLIRVEDLAKECRVKPDRVYQYHRDCVKLGLEGVEKVRKLAADSKGRATRNTFFTTAFANLFRHSLLPDHQAGEMTVSQMADRLGITQDEVRKRIEKGTLKARLGKIQRKGGAKANGWLVVMPGAKVQPAATAPNGQAVKPKRRRGRPGWQDDPEIAEKRKRILEDWKAGKYGTNKAELARAHRVDRAIVSRIVADNEKA